MAAQRVDVAHGPAAGLLLWHDAEWTSLTFWQYSNAGQLAGLTPVDEDVFRGDGAALTRLAQGTATVKLLAQANNRYMTAESAGRLPLIAGGQRLIVN